MAYYKFKPRETFIADLKRLGKLDHSIIPEIRAVIEMLLENQQLPAEYQEHQLKRQFSAYQEFHLRDTPVGKQPSDINDIVVIYTVDISELTFIGIRVGSHSRLFKNQNTSVKYQKPQK